MEDVCGLTLTYQNSLILTPSADLLLTPTHLLANIPIPIGRNEEIATALFYAQNTVIISLAQPNELLFLDSADYHEITRCELQGEPSALCVFGDFVAVFLRDKQALSVFALSTFSYLNTIGNLLPEYTPFIPRFVTTDQNCLVFECGMRVFCLNATLQNLKTIENKTTSSCELSVYEVAVGALCGAFCDKYLILGYEDSSVEVFASIEGIFESNIYEIDTCDHRLEGLDCVLLKNCLIEPEQYFELIQTVNLPEIVPKTAVSPKFGVSSIVSLKQEECYVATRGGLIIRLKFVLDLKNEKIEEHYEDSDDISDDIRDNEDPVAARSLADEHNNNEKLSASIFPELKFEGCSNLNLDVLLAGTAASTSEGSVISEASALQEETASWSDARSCCEVTNLCIYGKRVCCIIYDPISNCVHPIEFSEVETEYCLLQQVKVISSQFISAFALIYYEQIEPIRKHLIEVQDYLECKNESTKRVSLLSLASGSLKTDDSELYIVNSHIPSAIFTNSLRILRFEASSVKFAYLARRCAFSTREGHIYIFGYEASEQEIREEVIKDQNGADEIKTHIYNKEAVSGFTMLANCKIIDAILDIDISPTGTQIVAACTDAVRIFALNGNYLVCEFEIGIKMASKVLFPSTGFIINIVQNNIVHQIDPETGFVVGELQGHNDLIKDCCYLAPGIMRDTLLATIDADGVLYVWDRRGERVMEHVTRSKVTCLSPFYFEKPEKPHYCAMAADGIIKIFDILNSCFVYQGAVQTASTNGYSDIKQVIFDEAKHVFICSDEFGIVHVLSAPSEEMLHEETIQTKPIAMIDSNQAIGDERFSIAREPIAIATEEELGKQHDMQICSTLTLSPDLKYLCVNGANAPSTLILYKFSDNFTACIKRHVKEVDVLGDKNIDDYAFVDKCRFVDSNLFLKLQSVLSELEDRKLEVKLEYDHTLKVVQERHFRSLEEEKAQSEEEIQEAKEMTSNVSKTAEQEAEEFEKELADVGREHSSQLEKIEEEYRSKVGEIEIQKEETEEQIIALEEAHAHALTALQTNRESVLMQLNKEYDIKETKCRTEVQQLQNKLAECTFEAHEAQDQADEDTDTEIYELMGRSKAELDLKQTEIDSILAETGMIRNKFASIRKEILTFESNVTTCDNNIEALHEAVIEEQQELKTAEKEVEQRQDSIVEREKHIYELKNEAKELEKHRFVLDYKIKDLRKEIQPREQEIHDLTEQVREVGLELENYHKAIDQVEREIESARDEEHHLKQALVSARDTLIKTKQSLQYFSYETNRIIEDHGELSYDELRDRLEPLLAFGGEQRVDEEEQKADNEKAKHKAFLQEAARELSGQINEGKNDVVEENERIIEENTELLKEAAVLRREIQKIIHAPVSEQNTENSKVFEARLTAEDAEIKRLKKRVQELDEMEE